MPKSSKSTKTVAYDVAEQLRTPEEMAAYLDAWLTEAPDDIAGAKGMAQVAKVAGLSWCQAACGNGINHRSIQRP